MPQYSEPGKEETPRRSAPYRHKQRMRIRLHTVALILPKQGAGGNDPETCRGKGQTVMNCRVFPGIW